MSRISKIFYGEVDSVEYSCFVYIDTNPPIPAEAEFFVKVNDSWRVVFPNEINPGEYYQRVFDLKNGSNNIQFRIEYKGETFLSDVIDVLVEGQMPEITPPREPDPPVVEAHPVSVQRRVPCKIEYTARGNDPVIQHSYSEDEGKTWQTIEPGYESGIYSFMKYYTKAGSYKIQIRCMNNYWDVSEPSTCDITISKGEGDEPGYHITDTKDFVIQVDIPEPPPEPEEPSMYYVVKITYTDSNLAEQARKDLESKSYTVNVETREG